MTGPEVDALALVDGVATLLEKIADAIDAGRDLPALAGQLRAAAWQYRVDARPPLLEAEVRHAAALLRVADPRAVFPVLGRDLHAAGGDGS